jgi:hypothetical protein
MQADRRSDNVVAGRCRVERSALNPEQSLPEFPALASAIKLDRERVAATNAVRIV